MSFIRAARAYSMMPAPRVTYYPDGTRKPPVYRYQLASKKAPLPRLVAKGARRIVSAEYRSRGLDCGMIDIPGIVLLALLKG